MMSDLWHRIQVTRGDGDCTKPGIRKSNKAGVTGQRWISFKLTFQSFLSICFAYETNFQWLQREFQPTKKQILSCMSCAAHLYMSCVHHMWSFLWSLDSNEFLSLAYSKFQMHGITIPMMLHFLELVFHLLAVLYAVV